MIEQMSDGCQTQGRDTGDAQANKQTSGDQTRINEGKIALCINRGLSVLPKGVC